MYPLPLLYCIFKKPLALRIKVGYSFLSHTISAIRPSAINCCSSSIELSKRGNEVEALDLLWARDRILPADTVVIPLFSHLSSQGGNITPSKRMVKETTVDKTSSTQSCRKSFQHRAGSCLSVFSLRSVSGFVSFAKRCRIFNHSCSF